MEIELGILPLRIGSFDPFTPVSDALHMRFSQSYVPKGCA